MTVLYWDGHFYPDLPVIPETGKNDAANDQAAADAAAKAKTEAAAECAQEEWAKQQAESDANREAAEEAARNGQEGTYDIGDDTTVTVDKDGAANVTINTKPGDTITASDGNVWEAIE